MEEERHQCFIKYYISHNFGSKFNLQFGLHNKHIYEKHFFLLFHLLPSLDQVQGLGEVLHRRVGVLVVQGADGVLAQLLCPGYLIIGQTGCAAARTGKDG